MPLTHIRHRLLLIASAAMLALTSIVSAPASGAAPRKGKSAPDWDELARKRKAEYALYQAAASQAANTDLGEYAALLLHARALDPADPQIAGEWGMLTVAATTDSLTRDAGYRAVVDRYYADPSDYQNGLLAARMARMLYKGSDLVPIWEKIDSAFPSKSDPSLNLASAYLTRYIGGDSAAYHKAMDIYRELEAAVGKDISLTNYKLSAYVLRSDTASAIEELRSLYASAPLDPDINLYVGKGFSSFNRPDSALVYLRRACDLDSTNGQAALAMAAFYNQQGDSVAFDCEVFKALESPNLEFEPKMEMLTGYVSELYTDTAQRGRIEQLFDVMLDVNPGESKLHELFGAYLAETGSLDRAEEQFVYAAELDPTNSDARVTVVRVKFANNDLQGALEAALEAIPRFPTTMQFNLLASSAYSMLDSARSAIAVLDTIDLSRYNPRAGSEVQQIISDNYYRLGLVDSAMAYSERAIALNPDNAGALNNAAYYLSESDRDLDRAERYARTALQSDPDNPTYLDTYAWVYFKKKDFAKARKYIDATLAVLNLSPAEEAVDSLIDEAMAEITGSATAAGTDSSAEDTDIEAVEPDDTPTDSGEEPSPEILHHAGDIYFMNGEPDRAVEFWEEALKLDPDNELLQRKVKHRTFYYK